MYSKLYNHFHEETWIGYIKNYIQTNSTGSGCRVRKCYCHPRMKVEMTLGLAHPVQSLIRIWFQQIIWTKFSHPICNNLADFAIFNRMKIWCSIGFMYCEKRTFTIYVLGFLINQLMYFCKNSNINNLGTIVITYHTL